MRNLIIIVMLGVAGFAIAIYALPAWTNVVALRAELAKIEEIDKQVKDIAKDRDTLLERYREVTIQQSDRLNNLMPKNIYAEELYVFFEKFVPETGIAFDSISISAPVSLASSGEGQQGVGFDIKAKGTYVQVRSFLDGVENSLRLMDIDSVSITETAQNIYSVAVHGKMYYGS